MISKNSALYWLPKIQEYDQIPIPKTIIVSIADGDDWLWVSQPETAQNIYKSVIDDAVSKMGAFPIFVKTDELAGKHDWKNTCFIPSADDVYMHIHNLACVSSELNMPIKALLFRQFLSLDHRFNFFWGDLPIAKERRYFVKNEHVYCHHPYWDQSVFEDAFQNDDATIRLLDECENNVHHDATFSAKRRDEIRTILSEINTESIDEIALLTSYAQHFSSIHRDDAWSVDFACDINGKWYLIDAALAADSWHESSCINALKWNNRSKE